MKVLAIAHTMKAASGWGRYARCVTGEFTKRGIPFSVITAVPEEKTGEESAILEPPQGPGFIQNMFTVRKLARECDVVHAFDCWPYAVYGWAAVLGTNKKLFITGVGTYSVAPFNHLIKRILLGWACRRAEKIFCIADYTKQRMLEKIKLTNLTTVFWGASPLPVLSDAEKSAYAKKLMITSEQHPMLLTVGEVKHRKGQLDTLRALAKIHTQYPNLLYVVVGPLNDTGYVSKMKQLIAESGMENKVHLLGSIHDDTILSFLYDRTDIFVMNSNNDGDHFEGFGLVFLEAEQFGKPVVGSSGCGIEQALEDGYNGYLTRQGNADDIAEKLQKVLSSNMQELGQHSKEFYSRFTWEKTVTAYLQAYQGHS